MGAVATGGTDGRAGDIPLARLFAMAFRHLIDGLHARLAERGWSDVRPPYGFVLVAVQAGPTTQADLVELLGMTKQAVSKLLDGMEQAGYLTRAADPGDARAKVVALSRRGQRLLAAVEQIYAELEAEWAAAIGPRRVAALRRDLRAALEAAYGGRLPPVRPTW